jgi:hypothetical protein
VGVSCSDVVIISRIYIYVKGEYIPILNQHTREGGTGVKVERTTSGVEQYEVLIFYVTTAINAIPSGFQVRRVSLSVPIPTGCGCDDNCHRLEAYLYFSTQSQYAVP